MRKYAIGTGHCDIVEGAGNQSGRNCDVKTGSSQILG